MTLILKNILQCDEHQLSDSDTEKYSSVRRALTLVTLILKNILQYDEHQLSDSDTGQFWSLRRHIMTFNTNKNNIIHFESLFIGCLPISII